MGECDPHRRPPRNESNARQLLSRLRESGRIRPTRCSPADDTPIERVRRYERFLLNERGLKPTTVKRYHSTVRAFPATIPNSEQRHTAGAHELRAGVDTNTIRAWLGHARLDTTNIYVEIDVESPRALSASNRLPITLSQLPTNTGPQLAALGQMLV